MSRPRPPNANIHHSNLILRLAISNQGSDSAFPMPSNSQHSRCADEYSAAETTHAREEDEVGEAAVVAWDESTLNWETGQTPTEMSVKIPWTW